jgi:hypothetical protein
MLLYVTFCNRFHVWSKKIAFSFFVPIKMGSFSSNVFDGTPLLDIKLYIQALDVKQDANYGWLEDIEDRDHLMLHVKGIPHDY